MPEEEKSPAGEVLWHIMRTAADALQVMYGGLAYIVSGTWQHLCLLIASAIEAAVASVQALLGAASWWFRWLSEVLETVQKNHVQWPYFVTGAVIAIVSILAVCTMVTLNQVRTFMTVAHRQFAKVFCQSGKETHVCKKIQIQRHHVQRPSERFFCRVTQYVLDLSQRT